MTGQMMGGEKEEDFMVKQGEVVLVRGGCCATRAFSGEKNHMRPGRSVPNAGPTSAFAT